MIQKTNAGKTRKSLEKGKKEREVSDKSGVTEGGTKRKKRTEHKNDGIAAERTVGGSVERERTTRIESKNKVAAKH